MFVHHGDKLAELASLSGNASSTLNRQFCDRLLRRRSVRRKLRQRASATTTEDAAPLGLSHQTEVLTTMLGKILNLMETTRTIESCVYVVFVTRRDSTEPTSMVSRIRQCQQLCKESVAAFSSPTYMLRPRVLQNQDASKALCSGPEPLGTYRLSNHQKKTRGVGLQLSQQPPYAISFVNKTTKLCAASTVGRGKTSREDSSHGAPSAFETHRFTHHKCHSQAELGETHCVLRNKKAQNQTFLGRHFVRKQSPEGQVSRSKTLYTYICHVEETQLSSPRPRSRKGRSLGTHDRSKATTKFKGKWTENHQKGGFNTSKGVNAQIPRLRIQRQSRFHLRAVAGDDQTVRLLDCRRALRARQRRTPSS